MKILIIGGSNSLMADGYVKHMSHALKSHGAVEIKQLSVGATSSITAIARLFDTFNNEDFDFILYEYAINDPGHFAGRNNPSETYFLCLSLLIKTVAQFYPRATFVPLILSAETHFSLAADNPFYNMQTALFASLNLPVIDIRKSLSKLFLDLKPSWLYLNEAHYAAPQATTIVGSMVAAELQHLSQQGHLDCLSETAKKLFALPNYKNVNLKYLNAHDLKQYTSEPAEIKKAKNRLMEIDYLHMPINSTLSIESPMFPLALFIKSDKSHVCANILLRWQNDACIHTNLGTRHADVETFDFIYSSILLPFIFGRDLDIPFTPSHLNLHVPDAPIGHQAVDFDCFNHQITNEGQPNHLDLIGILFVANS